MLPLRKLSIITPDCTTFPCQEECCSAGCDVWPHERAALLDQGLAHLPDFEGPYEDDDGDWMYRTAIRSRGCTFLGEKRGCVLHDTGLKPEVCSAVPRDAAEVNEMVADGMLPCWRTVVSSE